MLKHPCIVQLRVCKEDEEKALKLVESFNVSIEKVKNGVDIYFGDVNDARSYLSKLAKVIKFKSKMSTSYAGTFKGRFRILFVYSVKCNENKAE
ncbi:MAG: NMD3-related protein [Archaeoglobales archaeon]|nr:NMD3-related protein [Archaeoglobales archaeon]